MCNCALNLTHKYSRWRTKCTNEESSHDYICIASRYNHKILLWLFKSEKKPERMLASTRPLTPDPRPYLSQLSGGSDFLIKLFLGGLLIDGRVRISTLTISQFVQIACETCESNASESDAQWVEAV